MAYIKKSPVQLAAALLGRRGGLSTSPAKQRASRLNGALGGRPRKDPGKVSRKDPGKVFRKDPGKDPRKVFRKDLGKDPRKVPAKVSRKDSGKDPRTVSCRRDR